MKIHRFSSLLCRSGLALLAAGFVAIGQAQPATPKTGAEAYDRHLAAVGGRAELAKIQTVLVTGTIQEGAQSFPFEFRAKLPGQVLVTATMPNGNAMRFGCDRAGTMWGERMGQVRNLTGLADTPVGDMALAFFPQGRSALRDALAQLSGVEETDEGRSVVAIADARNKDFPKFVFDRETGALRKVGHSVFDDYRAVGAVRVAFAVQYGPRKGIKAEKVQFNVPLDDAIFVRPAGKAASAGAGNFQKGTPVADVKGGDELRWRDVSGVAGLDAEKIKDLRFNQATRWSAPDTAIAADILQRGMNPGLGVRSLHQQGITGRGVSVGIIDQNIFVDHPEYKESIAQYHDVGCNSPKGSMHGPAVASLLVGKNIGTAPGAKLYFVAAPSWTKDAQFQADGLNWLLDVNEKLPAVEKIRVISVSASPSGQGSPFDKNNAAWDAACERAQNAGVLVLDCTSHRGIIGPCYYDIDAPEDVARVTPGFPGMPTRSQGSSRVLAPCSRRTEAEEYDEGAYAYQYSGRGGLSWSIPYAAGVLAMGWQVNPQLTAEQMVALLRQSAHDKDGAKIIDPVAFIALVKKQ